MWDVILDALVDSAKTLPFLLVVYLFIEFLETNEKARNKTVKLLNGKLAPLVASGVGLIPQCGFSVMATDLYCQNYLKIGTLIAFFVATSDEALPILLADRNTVGVVWVVLLIKIVYAVALGYFINLFDKRALTTEYSLEETTGCCNHDLGEHHDCADEEHSHEEEHSHDEHSHSHEEHNHKRGAKFWNFVKHPILHTVKIFVYIFVVNTILGLMLHFAEQEITDFTASLGFFQCFVTALLGLIPNCASSVIITEMFSEGIVGFSALISGLVTNSGIALALLFRKKKWRAFSIVGIMYVAGVLLGVLVYLIFPPIALL